MAIVFTSLALECILYHKLEHVASANGEMDVHVQVRLVHKVRSEKV